MIGRLMSFVKSKTFMYFVPISMAFIPILFRFGGLVLSLVYLNKFMPGLEISVSDNVLSLSSKFLVVLLLFFFIIFILQAVTVLQLLQTVSYILQAFLVVYVCVVAYVYVHYLTATCSQFICLPGVSFYKTSWSHVELLQILQQYIISSGTDLPPISVLNGLVGSAPTPEGVICAYEAWLLTPPPATDEVSNGGWLDWLSAHQELIVGCLAALTTLVSLASLGYKVYSLGVTCNTLASFDKIVLQSAYNTTAKVEDLTASVAAVREETVSIRQSIGFLRSALLDVGVSVREHDTQVYGLYLALTGCMEHVSRQSNSSQTEAFVRRVISTLDPIFSKSES